MASIFGFRFDKKKVEAVAIVMGKEKRDYQDMDGERDALLTILSDREKAETFFTMAKQKHMDEIDYWIREVRAAKNLDMGTFAITQFSLSMSKAWHTSWLETVNLHAIQEHELTLELFDALSGRSEKKVSEVREKLKKMEERQLTEEQMEAVDALLKGFKESGFYFGKKGE